MIKLKNINSILAAFTALAILVSCSGNSKKVKAEIEAQEFEKAENQIKNEIDKVVHDMPPPSEIPYLLQATGADYNESFTNPISNSSKYLNSADKAAMNLGGYAADIGYISSYEESQEALKYMEACQALAENLGISSVFELSMIERFETNASNKDSLANLLNLAMSELEVKLEKTDRLQTVALILAGSYIEGLYLSIMVLDTYPDDLLPAASRNLILEPLFRVIIGQKEPLEDIVKLLKDLESDPIIANVIAEFEILNLLYKEDIRKIDERIAKGDKTLVLDKKLLVDVIKEVKRIRTEMIK